MSERERRVLAVIPARIGSERLPRKPLHLIAGVPLIEWVWRRVVGFDLIDSVVIATDSEEVVSTCRRFGAQVVLTSPTHPSGTDRVVEVISSPPFDSFDIIVNIQGDEPFIGSEEVTGAIALVASGWDVGTAAGPIGTLEAWRDPSVVKVVCRDDGGALYFSRAPIPYLRDREPTSEELASGDFLRHVGVYAFSRERSEEHTSELQSRGHLVCRLLLEKKN